MTSVGSAPLVYSDTGMFLRFEQTLGARGLQNLLTYFDARLRIVTDVERELDYRLRSDFPDLSALKRAPMINEYLRGPAVTLAPSLVAQVGPVARTMPDAAGGGPRKNWGEVATVLQAASVGAAVIIDDREGRRLGRIRGVRVYTTRDVAVAMGATGAIPRADAYQVWAAVFPSWPAPRGTFDAAVAAFTP